MQALRKLTLRLGARSPAFRRAYGWFYHVPDRHHRGIPLSDDATTCLEDLRAHGVARYPVVFSDLAAYLNEAYFAPIESSGELNPWIVEDYNGERGHETGQSIGCYLSFRDPMLRSVLLSEELAAVYYHYYRRQPYYRNQPVINKIDFRDEHRVDITGKFHRDGGWHQLSCMFLVSEVTDATTHMEYARGSHQDNSLPNIDRFSYEDAAIESRFELTHLTGPPGTLYIFDAGNGFHRARFKAGSMRKILHLNLTTGHSIQPERFDTTDDWPELSSQPDFVQRLFEKVRKLA